METRNKLNDIRSKIQKLGDEQMRLKTELKRLSVERDVLKRQVLEQKQTIESIESKNVNLQIAHTGKTDSESSEQMRKKIDHYIKEIDKCIELLNS